MVIFSNNIRDTTFIEHVNISGGTRGCMTNGFGGAGTLNMIDFQYGIPGSVNSGINIDLGGSGTLVNMQEFTGSAGECRVRWWQFAAAW